MGRNWDIHIIPASHLDYGWAASPGECFSYVCEVIRTAIDDMESGLYPDFKFTVEYALFMRHFLEVYPEYLPTVKRLLREGRLEVCSTMTGPIEHFLDGEVLIHQLTQAKKWVRETLDYDPITAQHTDLPGHITQIAQILHKTEIQNFAYSRYHPPVPLHWWRSPDGSKVLACCHQHEPYDDIYKGSWEGYGLGWLLFVNETDPKLAYEDLPKLLDKRESIWPKGETALLMGCESDLQPGEPAMLERLAQWNERHPESPIHPSTISQFFKSVKGENLPTYEGEAPYSFFAITAMDPNATLELRKAASAVASAEKWSCFAQQLGLGQVQRARLNRARESFYLPHDHNLSGRRGEVNDQERFKDAWHARLEGESIVQENAMKLMVHIGFKQLKQGVYPVTVFNSLSWKRTDLVDTYIEVPMEKVKSLNITDAKGKPVASQIVFREEKWGYSRLGFVFVAPDVPAHGYTTFYVRPSQEPEAIETSLKTGKDSAASRFFKLKYKDHFITSIQWQGRELVRKGGRRFNEIYMLQAPLCNVEAAPWEVEKTYTGKGWDCTMTKTEVLEEGPVRTVLRFTGRLQGTKFQQYVTLYDALERIDFHHSVDYKPKDTAHVRVSYPLAAPGAEATYESVYAAVALDKEEMEYTFRGQGERWVQQWVDLSNQEFGVTLSTRHIAVRIDNETIEPILLRTTFDCGTIFHHVDQEKVFTFDYSLAPHEGDWKKSAAHRAGWEWNSPLQPCNWTSCFPIKPLRRSKKLPETDSFLQINRNNVVITAVVPSAAVEGAYVVRAVEFFRRAGDATLTFHKPVKQAEEVNLLENAVGPVTVQGNKVTFHTDAAGIHSIRVVLED